MPHPLDPDWALTDCLVQHRVMVGWHSGSAKVCKIQFHKEGLFVHFPYHPNTEGLIALCELHPGQTQLRPAERGGIVSHKVKYSHHGDGTCLFSQDGRVRSVVRTTDGRPLVGAAGQRADHLFTIDVEGLETFSEPSEAERTSDQVGRAFFDIDVAKAPAVHIVARWTKYEGEREIAKIPNPMTAVTPNGELRQVLALSPRVCPDDVAITT